MVDQAKPPPTAAGASCWRRPAFRAVTVHALGCYAPCTARLSNRVHSFFVATGARAEQPAIEAGIELRLVTPAELGGLIQSGEFVLQLHIGAIMLAGLAGHINLAAFQLPGQSEPAKP